MEQISRDNISLVSICLKFLCQNLQILTNSTIELTFDVQSLLFSFVKQRRILSDSEIRLLLPPNQVQLHLADSVKITDVSLLHLSSITGSCLVNLSLADCSRITDAGLEMLSQGLPVLHKLDLLGCFQISHLGLKALMQGCTLLEDLDLSECYGLDDRAVLVLLKSKSLTFLTMADCAKVSWTFQNCSGFVLEDYTHSSLKSLCLRRCSIQDESINLISTMCPDLRILDISWCLDLTDRFSQYFSKGFKKLFALNMWGLKRLTDSALASICRSCTGLSSLTICDCTELTENSIVSIIAILPNLNTLNLWGCVTFSTASIQLLIRHRSGLQGLGLSYCSQLNDNALANMANLTSLKALQLESCNRISDETIKDLGSPNFMTINFRKCTRLTSAAIEECVRRSPSVTSLTLSYCQLREEFIHNIFPLISGLKILDLSGCVNVNENNLTNLAKSDLAMSLTTLKLDECLNITDTAVQQVLKFCTRLQTISFSFCQQLSDAAFAQLSNSNFELLSISIGGCGQFTDAAFRKIAQFCPRLRDLVLPLNKEVTDESCLILAQSCFALRSINLAYCNKVTDAGVKALVINCKNLRRLDLGYCSGITITGLVAVAVYCKNLQLLRIKKHSSSVISTFFEDQMHQLCPHLKIEVTN